MRPKHQLCLVTECTALPYRPPSVQASQGLGMSVPRAAGGKLSTGRGPTWNGRPPPPQRNRAYSEAYAAMMGGLTPSGSHASFEQWGSGSSHTGQPPAPGRVSNGGQSSGPKGRTSVGGSGSSGVSGQLPSPIGGVLPFPPMLVAQAVGKSGAQSPSAQGSFQEHGWQAGMDWSMQGSSYPGAAAQFAGAGLQGTRAKRNNTWSPGAGPRPGAPTWPPPAMQQQLQGQGQGLPWGPAMAAQPSAQSMQAWQEMMAAQAAALAGAGVQGLPPAAVLAGQPLPLQLQQLQQPLTPQQQLILLQQQQLALQQQQLALQQQLVQQQMSQQQAQQVPPGWADAGVRVGWGAEAAGGLQVGSYGPGPGSGGHSKQLRPLPQPMPALPTAQFLGGAPLRRQHGSGQWASAAAGAGEEYGGYPQDMSEPASAQDMGRQEQYLPPDGRWEKATFVPDQADGLALSGLSLGLRSSSLPNQQQAQQAQLPANSSGPVNRLFPSQSMRHPGRGGAGPPLQGLPPGAGRMEELMAKQLGGAGGSVFNSHYAASLGSEPSSRKVHGDPELQRMDEETEEGMEEEGEEGMDPAPNLVLPPLLPGGAARGPKAFPAATGSQRGGSGGASVPAHPPLPRLSGDGSKAARTSGDGAPSTMLYRRSGDGGRGGRASNDGGLSGGPSLSILQAQGKDPILPSKTSLKARALKATELTGPSSPLGRSSVSMSVPHSQSMGLLPTSRSMTHVVPNSPKKGPAGMSPAAAAALAGAVGGPAGRHSYSGDGSGVTGLEGPSRPGAAPAPLSKLQQRASQEYPPRNSLSAGTPLSPDALASREGEEAGGLQKRGSKPMAEQPGSNRGSPHPAASPVPEPSAGSIPRFNSLPSTGFHELDGRASRSSEQPFDPHKQRQESAATLARREKRRLSEREAVSKAVSKAAAATEEVTAKLAALFPPARARQPQEHPQHLQPDSGGAYADRKALASMLRSPHEPSSPGPTPGAPASPKKAITHAHGPNAQPQPSRIYVVETPIGGWGEEGENDLTPALLRPAGGKPPASLQPQQQQQQQQPRAASPVLHAGGRGSPGNHMDQQQHGHVRQVGQMPQALSPAAAMGQHSPGSRLEPHPPAVAEASRSSMAKSSGTKHAGNSRASQAMAGGRGRPEEPAVTSAVAAAVAAAAQARNISTPEAAAVGAAAALHALATTLPQKASYPVRNGLPLPDPLLIEQLAAAAEAGARAAAKKTGLMGTRRM